MKTNRFISLLLCVVMIMSLFTGLAGSASADDVIVHEVQSGEIMLKICEKHGLNYYACKNAIMQLNGFTSEAQLGKLSVGQKIKLPASDALAGSVSTTSAVVTSTTIGGTTMTTTTSYVGTTATGGNIAYYLTAYTVQAGDTLAGICNKLGSNYYYYSPVILGINSLTNANYIRPGQVLLIPTSTPGGAGYAVVAHQVQPGETTTSICNRYGVSYQAMRQLVNGLNRRDNMDKIYAGQTVYVPTTNAGAVATTVVSTGTTTTTTGTTAAASSGYTITFVSGGAFASVNGQDYVTSAPAGSEVSVWSTTKAGYVVKSMDVVRLDTGAPVPTDYNYFTMPNSNIAVDVAYEKGLSITKAKAQGGSFETLVGGFLSDAAFQGDLVTVLAYPNQFYSVTKVSYQKADGTVSPVDVKQDSSGNYSFTMPSYPVKLSVSFAPTQYHSLSYSSIIGQGKVGFYIGDTQVTKAEQGQTVAIKFTPDANWAFNASDFENSLDAHISNRASMGSFKKVDENTYSFVMGTQDINVSGVQFINRNTYTVTGSVWADMTGATNGYVTFNVVDQATGNITYGSTQAKFGDTVQVIYNPGANHLPDTQYAKDNSKGAGNALLSWTSDSTFTMPDSNATVNARFVTNGETFYPTGVGVTVVPWAGGTVKCISDGAIVSAAAPGKVVTVKIEPKVNYDLSVAKIAGGVKTYAVTLNGKLVGEAPAASSFTQVDPTDPYTYTFVKSAGYDTISVAFASAYDGVNATFTQVTEGGDPVVQSIKGFSINGNAVAGDVQVVSGDTLSFTVEVLEGYEILRVRKFIWDKSTSAEIAGTTAYIPGGTDNSFSYTVTKDDISVAKSVPSDNGQIVFEITCRKNPENYYTVKYTRPVIDGATPVFEGGTTPVTYTLSASPVFGAWTATTPAAADIAGISWNLVAENDVMVKFDLKAKNAKVTDPVTGQTKYYAFDKLLINGEEWADIDTSSTPGHIIANFVLPMDAPDGIVTTEVVFKQFKTEDAKPITLTPTYTITTVAAVAKTIQSGVYDYTMQVPNDSDTVDLTTTTTPTPTTSTVTYLLNGSVPTDPTKAQLLTGLNTLQIKLSNPDPAYKDTTYTFTINYGMDPTVLDKLTVWGKEVSPNVSLHPSELPIYEVLLDMNDTTPPTPYKVELAVPTTPIEHEFVRATWELNGSLIYIDQTAKTQEVGNKSGINPEANVLKVGANTLKITVESKVKSTGLALAPTTYVVNINFRPKMSALTNLTITGVNADGSIYKDGQTQYEVTATKNPFKLTVITAVTGQKFDYKINDQDWVNGNSSGTISTDLWWDNTLPGTSNTLLIRTKADGCEETIYTISAKPDFITPAALEIYMKDNATGGTMIPFSYNTAYYNTICSVAEFAIEVPATTTRVKVDINGTEQYPFKDGSTTHTVKVDIGEKVTHWNVGSNTVTITVRDENDKDTVYTVYVNYQATPITFKTVTLSRNGGTAQNWPSTYMNVSKAAADKDTYAATTDVAGATVTYELDGATATFPIDWSTQTVGTHYVDITVSQTGYTSNTYHIQVNVTE